METAPIKKYDITAQHNFLVRAPLKLNITEARIFSLALACMRKGDDELATIRIRFDDIFPNPNGSDYETLSKACAGLMGKVVTLRSVSGSSKVTEMYSIISFLKLDAGTGLVTGSFDNKIAPYLIGFANRFTTLELETLLMLKNPHTHRIMWILKSYQHENEGVYEVDIETFRKMILGENYLNHYPVYSDFKRFILLPVMEELNDPKGVNWSVELQETRTGLRKITGLRFKIPVMAETKAQKKKKTMTAIPRPRALPVVKNIRSEWEEKLFIRCTNLKLTSYQTNELLKVLGGDDNRIKKLMNDIYKHFANYTTSGASNQKIGSETINVLKTLVPQFYNKEE